MSYKDMWNDIIFPYCLVIGSFSIICPCHLSLLQAVHQHITLTFLGFCGSSYAIFLEVRQCLTWYLHVIHSVFVQQWHFYVGAGGTARYKSCPGHRNFFHGNLGLTFPYV